MTDYKLVLADPKTGKCYQREAKDAEAEVFLGKKLGEKIKGDSFGLNGYEFEITGGSDSCGFPMRKDVNGTERKRILVISGVGAKIKRKGQRQRKNVRGHTIGRNISQINLKIIKYGKVKLGVTAETPKEGEDSKEKAEEKVGKDSKKEKDEPVEKEKSENKPEEKSEEESKKDSSVSSEKESEEESKKDSSVSSEKESEEESKKDSSTLSKKESEEESKKGDGDKS
ncbi:30S ribosomal protein S6e [Candidatus Woesearchaeota archaeon]|nr:30S ribosomal protein S6e [Candidatus Woesearchaeota archaeon]